MTTLVDITLDRRAYLTHQFPMPAKPRKGSAQLLCSGAETMCAACAKLVELGEVPNVRKHSAKAEKTRLKILSDINEYHDLFSRRLPVELRSEILQLCIDDIESLSERPFACRSSRRPLVLSQVSRTWRALCHSLPRLWALMPMYVEKPDMAYMKVVTELASKWIGRAGDFVPLSIILDISPYVDALLCRPLFKVINSCSARLQFLQIEGLNRVLVELLSIYQRRSRLTHIRLTCAFDLLSDYVHRKAPEGISKFKPTHLFLENAMPDDYGIDIKNLSNFECQDMSIFDCFDIICSAHKMTSCTLLYSPCPMSFPTALPDMQIVHSAMQHFQARIPHDIRPVEVIFSVFDFPSLESVTIQPPLEHQTRLLTSLTRNFRRSHSALKKFVISELSFHDMGGTAVFVDLLDVVSPSLQHLEIMTGDDFDGETTQIANILYDFSTRLPEIRFVKIYMNGEKRVSSLQDLLVSCAAIALASKHPVSFVFWTHDHHIRDQETGNIQLVPKRWNNRARRYEVDEDQQSDTARLALEEIQTMIETLRNDMFSVKVMVAPYGMAFGREKDADKALDMTEEVVEALTTIVNVKSGTS